MNVLFHTLIMSRRLCECVCFQQCFERLCIYFNTTFFFIYDFLIVFGNFTQYLNAVFYEDKHENYMFGVINVTNNTSKFIAGDCELTRVAELNIFIY